MTNPPTLKQLAKELRLSVPAVSMGLRNAGNISEATCLRIQEAAKKMGYRPNPHAAALSSSVRVGAKHGVPLALIRMPLQQNSYLYPIRSIVKGITQRGSALGYRVEVLALNNSTELTKLLKNLYNRGFQGVFLPPIGKDFRADDHDWSPFSVIACGRYDQPSPFNTVRQEVFESTRFLFNEVIRRGYRRICVELLEHDPQIVDDFERLAAATVSHPKGRKIKVRFFSKTEYQLDFFEWLKIEQADAAIGFNSNHYSEMIQSGIKIPEEIGFASFHTNLAGVDAKITGLVSLTEHMGMVAANRIDTMIRHHERGIPLVPEQIAIASQWQEGTTLPFLK